MDPVNVHIGGTYELQDENGSWRLAKVVSYSFDDMPGQEHESPRPPAYKVQYLHLNGLMNGLDAGAMLVGPVMNCLAKQLRVWSPGV